MSLELVGVRGTLYCPVCEEDLPFELVVSRTVREAIDLHDALVALTNPSFTEYFRRPVMSQFRRGGNPAVQVCKAKDYHFAHTVVEGNIKLLETFTRTIGDND